MKKLHLQKSNFWGAVHAVKAEGVIIMSTAKLFQLPLPYKTKSTATQVTVLWL